MASRFEQSTILERNNTNHNNSNNHEGCGDGDEESPAKRARRTEDSDEEFASLLENDEDLHRIITQKEQEAAR